jgi:hypothetical protein
MKYPHKYYTIYAILSGSQVYNSSMTMSHVSNSYLSDNFSRFIEARHLDWTSLEEISVQISSFHEFCRDYLSSSRIFNRRYKQVTWIQYLAAAKIVLAKFHLLKIFEHLRVVLKQKQ